MRAEAAGAGGGGRGVTGRGAASPEGAVTHRAPGAGARGCVSERSAWR